MIDSASHLLKIYILRYLQTFSVSELNCSTIKKLEISYDYSCISKLEIEILFMILGCFVCLLNIVQKSK